jgi:hemerythrin superfamily protein
MTDGFERLEQDHRSIRQLFEAYAQEPEDDHVREIIGQLTVHTEVEERALYPELRKYVDGGDDDADEAEAEHAAVRVLIGRIELSPPADVSGLMETMRSLVEQHVEQEERSLFPAMREAGVDADALADRLSAAERTVAP